jgi:hypothetical protein
VHSWIGNAVDVLPFDIEAHVVKIYKYGQTSVHELNLFLKVVHKLKLFSPYKLM